MISSNNKILYTLLCVLSLWILLKIYKYLTELEKCTCYNDMLSQEKLKINIDFLKGYQIFEMCLVFLFIIIIYCRESKHMNIFKNSFQPRYLTTSIGLLMAFATGYLSYNTFLLYMISKDKCECMDKWEKYFLYVQGIMNSATYL